MPDKKKTVPKICDSRQGKFPKGLSLVLKMYTKDRTYLSSFSLILFFSQSIRLKSS